MSDVQNKNVDRTLDFQEKKIMNKNFASVIDDGPTFS